MQDKLSEEPSRPARFDGHDDEETEENNDNVIANEYDGEDMPSVEWNRETNDVEHLGLQKSMKLMSRT
jgi:hypothetical protein